MKRLVLAFHGDLIEAPREWEFFFDRSRFALIEPFSGSGRPEAAWLGLRPEEWDIAEGPLWGAAAGFVFDSGTMVFAVSLLGTELTAAEESEVDALLARLDGPNLRMGRRFKSFRHLVWENGSRDGSVVDADAAGLLSRPEGDFERPIGGWIDTARELLEGAEFNRRRLGEGVAPLEMVWPWGAGPGVAPLNFPLMTGEIWRWSSTNVVLAGLTKLCTLPHAWGQELSTIDMPEPTGLLMDLPEDPDESAWQLRDLANRMAFPEDLRVTFVFRDWLANFDSRRMAAAVPFRRGDVADRAARSLRLDEAIGLTLKQVESGARP